MIIGLLLKMGMTRVYTHGHLSHITKSCDSGVDINIAVDSRLFTDVIGFYKTPEGDLRFQSRFEEENRLTVEHTNWRSFDELYQRAGLTIGHLSQERFHLAGREQKLFHDSLSSITGTDASDFEDQRAEHSEYIQTSDLQILKYEYLPEDKEKTFIGAHIAFGKSYSLNNLKGTCASPCVNYFRTEAGVEMISLKHGSNVYILSEIDKAIHHPWDALSVFASLKAQKMNIRIASIVKDLWV